MNHVKKIIYLLAGLALAGCDDKPSTPQATATATATVAIVKTSATAKIAPTAAASAAAKGTGNKDVTETISQLPAVNESFHAAKEAGLLDEWQRAAPFKPRKLGGMKPGETAIEVGKVLVDVAVLTADTKKKITPEVVQQVVEALKAMHPPASAQQPIDALAEDLKKGGKDEELRAKLSSLIVSTLPALEEDPKLASSAGLAMAGGYLRSLAITSKLLSSGAAADQDKLDLLHRQQENAYFVDLLSTKLDASVKGEAAVKDALDALQKIKSHVAKAKPSADDARAIAAALARYAS